VTVRGDVSSQFLTALLMALPTTGAGATVEVAGELISKPYVEITLNLMARFGVDVERDGWRAFRIPAGARYRSPGTVFVEGDASAASYFLAAGAIGGGPVRVEGVGRDSIQGDVRFAEALAAMGAQVSMGPNWIEARAPAGGRLKAIRPRLQPHPRRGDDPGGGGTVRRRDDAGCATSPAGGSRRPTARRHGGTELRKLGATVEEGATTSPSRGDRRLPGASIDTYDDHRMAMCLSLACLGGVPLRINDPQCVNKTFPDYFERFAGLLAPVIAIDGPSASGKGTVAALVAERLGFHYLDSGALYRLVALAAIRAGVSLEDGESLARIAETLPARFEGGRILLGGTDATEAIRSEECSAGSSKVAAFPAVRGALLGRQRAYRQAPGLVAEGRDMGSVVFRDAALKVFLTATPEARAERRHKQLISKGMSVSIGTLLQDLRERDARDSARAVAPLQKCADAELLDTTAMTVEEAVRGKVSPPSSKKA
jgi:3-phosphoshikimate 1-carboxyvinyltransferase